MGLFTKKSQANDIRVMHYEGLHGFLQDATCVMLATQDAILFKSIQPPIEVTLPRAQVISFNIMPEKNFMARYYGNAGCTSKFGEKIYAVIQYTSSQGEECRLAFWYAAADLGVGNKLQALMTSVQEASTPSSYTL